MPMRCSPKRQTFLRTGLCVCLILAAGLCAVDGSAASLDAMLTDSVGLQGWKLEGAPYHYSPANLYTYINGAADFFIAYGFCELVGAAYGSKAGDGSLITIDIYDMGEKLNAFGVFQTRRDPAAPAADIGAAAMVSSDYLVFFKDRYYVEVQGVIKDQSQRPRLQAAGRSIADHLPGDARLPEQLVFFPPAALIAGSERYVRGGILGHAYWDRGLLSDYQLDDTRCTAFIVLLGSEEEARASLERHRSFLQGSGKQCRVLDGLGGRGFASDEPHHKKILVAQAGHYVAGVYDLPSLQKGRHLLEDILRNLRSRKTP